MKTILAFILRTSLRVLQLASGRLSPAKMPTGMTRINVLTPTGLPAPP
ncbi:MAG: hypothetical protein WBO18_03125 [Gammaproteobacteria bacterium]